jgi:hypothetical protein
MPSLPSLRLSGAARRGARRQRLAVAMVAGGLLAGTLATGVSAAPRPLTMQVVIGDYCVYGGAKPNTTVKVVIRDSSGDVKGRQVVIVDPYGGWYGCTDYGDVITGGDRIKVADFETGQTRKFTVPRITIDANRVTDVVSGKAPAGSQLMLEVADYDWSYFGLDDYDDVAYVTASGAGAYSFDFSTDGIDLGGGAMVMVTWSNASGTVQVLRAMTVPYIAFRLGHAQFMGSARPSKHVAVSLTIGPTEVATGDAEAAYGPGDSFYYSTDYSGRFVDADGEPYQVQGGEHLSAPALGSDADWDVPAIAGSVDVATDKVSGTCFPNQLYIVFVSGQQSYGYDYGTAAANGAFTIDMTYSAGNVRRGDTIEIVCVDSSLDWVEQDFIAH